MTAAKFAEDILNSVSGDYRFERRAYKSTLDFLRDMRKLEGVCRVRNYGFVVDPSNEVHYLIHFPCRFGGPSLQIPLSRQHHGTA